MHDLENKWTLYSHFSNDTKWDETSYKKICEISCVEEALVLFNLITNDLFQSVMFFLMRDDIKPMWEVDENANGGAFSFKVSMDNIQKTWANICFQCIGETLIDIDTAIGNKYINGISFSPKKSFGILKIWTKSCEIQEPNVINYFDGMTKEGCIFKKHISQ